MNWLALNTIVLSLTLIAVAWYAIETKGMKKQMVRQLELSVRPFVVIDYKEQGDKFFLRNLGNGAAFSVKLSDIMSSGGGFKYCSFCQIDFIPDHESRHLYLDKVDGGESRAFHWGALIPRSATTSFYYEISYRDIDGTEYLTTGMLGAGGITVDSHHKA